MKKSFLLSLLAIPLVYTTPITAMERKRKREEKPLSIETKKIKTVPTVFKRQIFPETSTSTKSLRQIGKEKVIKQLIEENFENVADTLAKIPEDLKIEITNEQLYNGNTLLHLITNPADIEPLIQAGSDPHIPNNDGQSVFNYYVAQGKLNAAHRLLELPIQINVVSRDVFINNPLIYAIKQGDFELATKIIEYTKNISSNPPAESDKEITLLNLKNMINLSNNAHQNPLTLAIKNGAPQEIIRLLAQWANIHQLTANETPLMLAARYNPRAIKTLIDLGANPNEQNNELRSPLIIAATANPRSIRPLVEGGAKVNAINIDDETPLMHAATVEAAQELLQAGAHINFINQDGLSALSYIIHDLSDEHEDFEYENLINIMVYLLEQGAQIRDVDIKAAENAKKVMDTDGAQKEHTIPDILKILQRYPEQWVKE